jgi:TPR repeat protein
MFKKMNRLSKSLRKRSETIEETLDSKLTIQPAIQAQIQGNSSASSLFPPISVQPTSLNTALELYKLGEDQLLGINGSELDEKKGFKNIKKASIFENHVQAQALLGFCFEFGLGTDQDFVAAENLYITAAKASNGLARARLAFLRRYGRPSIKIDRVEAEEWLALIGETGSSAIEWLVKAAQEGQPAGIIRFLNNSATYCLGVCYHDGIGVEKDAELAVHYYKLSASKGQPRGEGILGYCYGEGFGVEKDELKALSLYLKAAKKGESVSMYNVAHCYEEGFVILFLII